MNRHPKTKQSGVALITVLLVVVFALLLTSAMSEQQHLDIRRTSNLLAITQAKAYALSAEDIAKAVLYADLKKDTEKDRFVDHHKEDWLGYKTSGLGTERISGGVTDLNSKFNLNWVRDPQYPEARRMFQDLLSNLGIPTDPNSQVATIDLANAVYDWMDEDDMPIGIEGEDLYYLGLEKPYRTANSYFNHITELRLVKGFTDKDIKKLEPFVTVLPKESKLNLNTAEQEVLDAIGNSIDAAKIIDGRGDNGYDTVDDALSGQKADIKKKFGAMLDVRSEYFEMDGKTLVNDRTVKVYSIIYRPKELDEDNKFEIYYRDFGKKYLVLETKDPNAI